MKSIKSIFTVIAAAGFAILWMAMISVQPQKTKPWNIPEKYKSMKNSVTTTEASIKAGETAYRKNCASCHGKTGLGDGIKAKTLETFPGDLTSAEFQNQSDGVIFYQSKFGRGEMPKYENKIEDTDLWNMVNYMRTLKK